MYFKAMSTSDIESHRGKQNIFFDGQIYDAFSFIVVLIQKAKKEIIYRFVNHMLHNREEELLGRRLRIRRMSAISSAECSLG